MKTTVAINSDKLIKRLDEKQTTLGFHNRSNLVEVILRKGLDYLDNEGYDSFIKIPISEKVQDK